MIKKYNNFKIINEKISFEDFCSKTQHIKKMIIDQNEEIIENAQHMMYDIFDITGHVPCFFRIFLKSSKIGVSQWLLLDLKAEEEYFQESDFDEDGDEEFFQEYIDRIRKGDDIKLIIHYQHACEENDWTHVKLTQDIKDANESVKETLKSLGVELIIKLDLGDHSQSKDNAVWYYQLHIPIKLKLNDIIDDFEVDKNTLKRFKEFIKKYNIPKEGESEISNIIRGLKTK